MEYLFGLLQKTSRWLAVVAGVALTLMMFLTVADVVMRAGGSPIMGTYEIVGLSLALVVGFSIPRVSLNRQHIYMDFLVDNISKRNKALMNIFTRILCVILFVLIGYSLFSIGNEFRMSGEVSPTVRLPFYPMAYGVGICCFIECFVFLFDIVKSWRAIHE
jgi:TRAP-type C4-dicarboxylate transport system permease small subunit